MQVHWNRHFSLFSFRLACLHLHYTCSKLASWSLPSKSKPAIRTLSAMLKTLGMSFSNSPFFFGTYHPPVQLHVVVLYTNTCQMDKKILNIMIFHWPLDYDIQSWHLPVWVTWPVSFGSMSLSPCGLVLSMLYLFWLSKHNLTFPLALGTQIKLLHHSDVSSTPNGKMICCFSSHSSSSFSGFFSA